MQKKKKHKPVIYIHYGSEHFQPEQFNPIKNRVYPWVKPEHESGMWASPVKSNWGWKKWCIGENFHVDRLEKSFRFTLAKDARVCHLRSVDDLLKLPIIHSIYNDRNIDLFCCIDFEKAMQDYDAIELHLTQEPPMEFGELGLYYLLYGWDCDSILVLNPDVVKERRSHGEN